MGIRGPKPKKGMPPNGHRIILVKDVALWDWAIERAAQRRMSLSEFIENLFRNQVERESQ